MDKPKNTRWRLTKYILTLATLGFFVPIIINFILQFTLGVPFEPLVLLSASEWVAVVTLIIGVYTTFNVAQDHIFKNKTKEKVEGQTVEDEGD